MVEPLNNLMNLLDDKLREANDMLLLECRILTSKNVEGISKLERKIQIEIDNLIKYKENPGGLSVHHLNGSNLNHYKSLCKIATEYSNVASVLTPFRRPDNTIVFVDIVSENGATWVKVVARNAKGLHFSFTGESYSKEKSILRQAQDYVDAALNNPYHYEIPKIIFEFAAGVTEPIWRNLVKLGIQPKGDIIEIPTVCYSNSDLDSSDSTSSDTVNEEESLADNVSGLVAVVVPEILNGLCNNNEHFAEITSTNTNASCSLSSTKKLLPINLDITAFFAFVSNMTNGFANYRFKSPMLNEQAEWERIRPVLPYLNEVIADRKLICCRTAYNSFRSILENVGGPNERIRADNFLQKITVLDDGSSPKIDKLLLGGKIKERSKVIFGSGEFYRAITLTANKSFILAAESQNVKLAVILHESRALSEEKQQTASPIDSSEPC